MTALQVRESKILRRSATVENRNLESATETGPVLIKIPPPVIIRVDFKEVTSYPLLSPLKWPTVIKEGSNKTGSPRTNGLVGGPTVSPKVTRARLQYKTQDFSPYGLYRDFLHSSENLAFQHMSSWIKQKHFVTHATNLHYPNSDLGVGGGKQRYRGFMIEKNCRV
ncbi:uncharacterized protein BDR25DRAFT_356638 [Lindgomyces ingoldianus]|uniref:Uncharacterized protein n=1 Tax=Lindgomyces ingoldianus TaxID=673940 RepID=A0ACB6QQY2_9PLEO|nr:uncharacterized protein BDR25DRAFT_356638 [Lindgomyces ingoldianus]KAF2469404.1 hypothetical protein BDR25DRAFT_356638 [Lindgomyces ingoldianus]